MNQTATTDIEKKINDVLVSAQAKLIGVDLFAAPRPKEDCPICFNPLPLKENGSVTLFCCGKVICCGCLFKHLRTNIRTKSKGTCAFCRQPVLSDRMGAIHKQMQKNHPRAFMHMGDAYREGECVPQSYTKALEMYYRAAELGHTAAFTVIGGYYAGGLVVGKDLVKSVAFSEIAAKMGCIESREWFAAIENTSGNRDKAVRHWTVAASAGSQASMTKLWKAFRDKAISKEVLDQTFRAFQASNDELKSKDRDDYAAHLAKRAKDR